MIADRFTRMLVGAHEGCRRNPTVEGIHMHYALVLLASARLHNLGGVYRRADCLPYTRVVWPRGQRT